MMSVRTIRWFFTLGGAVLGAYIGYSIDYGWLYLIGSTIFTAIAGLFFTATCLNLGPGQPDEPVSGYVQREVSNDCRP
jgi:hypothetical protein